MLGTRIEPDDWYDGIVQGRVWLDHLPYYAILLAWDMQRDARFYLIFPISEEPAEIISAVYNGPGDWSPVVKLLTTLVNAGPLHFTQDDPVANHTLQLRPAPGVTSAQLRFKKFTIERTLSETAIRTWLGQAM